MATGILLTPRDGVRWRFDPGALFLEYLLTGGPDDLAVWDRLHSPADLRDWVGVSRLGLAGTDVLAGEGDVPPARRLRDALWRATRSGLAGAPVDRLDRVLIEEAAAAAPLVPTWTGWQVPATAAAVLATVARDGLTTLAGPAAGRIRECAADDCRLVFLDTSRPGARRWCSMRRCGNRHKVRDHRARHLEEP